LQGGKIFYDSPTNAPVSDSFFYQVSDNSAAGRGGPLTASAKVDISVVDFVPKTISGTVTANGKVLAGVEIRLTGVDFTDKVLEDTAGKGYMSVVTDADGRYVFPASGLGLAPPKAGTSYQLSEVQPEFLIDGVDVHADLTPNIDTTTNAKIVNVVNLGVDANGLDKAFLLTWSVTDLSGNLTDVNFIEGGINTNPATGGVTDLGGIKTIPLASTGKNGYMLELDESGNMSWNWSLEGDANAWDGCSILSAILSPDTHSLTLSILRNGVTKTVTLTETYSIAGSSARFAKIGVGANGEYIIRIIGSYNGTSIDSHTGLYDGMFVSNTATLQGAEGEAAGGREFANSADALFAQQAWA
jgi:hypothetical protein